MTIRQAGTRLAGVAMLVLAGCALEGCSLQPILIGQWYTIWTPAQGACPRLEWRFVADAKRSIGGYIAGDRQQRIATLSGVLAADDSFQMTARSLEGQRTADVTGQFGSVVSTISVRGDAAGAGCDRQTFRLRIGRYLSYQGGGGGGGGR